MKSIWIYLPYIYNTRTNILITNLIQDMPTLQENIRKREILVQKRDEIQKDIKKLSIRIANAKLYYSKKVKVNEDI